MSRDDSSNNFFKKGAEFSSHVAEHGLWHAAGGTPGGFFGALTHTSTMGNPEKEMFEKRNKALRDEIAQSGNQAKTAAPFQPKN